MAPGPGFCEKGNRIAIVTDRPVEVVEVHKLSVNAVNMAGEECAWGPTDTVMRVAQGARVLKKKALNDACHAPAGT